MALTRITTGSISANSISAEKMQNAAIQARHFQAATITLDLMDANANTAAAEARINANLDIVQDNVVINQTGINTVQSNLVLAEANIVLVRSNVDSFGVFANTDLDTKANVSATYFLALANDLATFTHITANLNTVQDNVVAVETRLNANLDTTNDNVNNIINGTTPFTGAVTMQDDLTIQGNLTVAGNFANLAVTDSYTDDRLIILANSFTGAPSLDVGILLNRGNDGNIFIGYDESEGEVALLHNQDPATNTSISATGAANLRLQRGYFDDGTAALPTITFDGDDNTGLFKSTTDTVGIASGGVEVITIGPDGATTITSDDAGSAAGPELTLYRNSASPAAADYIGQVVFKGENSTGGQENYAKVTGKITDPTAGSEDGLIETAIKGAGAFTIVSRQTAAQLQLLNGVSLDVDNDVTASNVSASTDLIATNATISTLIFENGVGMSANDSATYFAAYANDYVTYTRLNANVNSVQSNLSTAHTDLSSNMNLIQDNVDAITGGGTFLAPFTNVNTATGTSNVFFVGKNVSAEANVILVMIDGVSQANTEYEVNASNDTVQFKDASIPSGSIIQIFSMT
ncbi:MAG: hypothetical protein VW577_02270 [Pelagibacteraceae bacterium]